MATITHPRPPALGEELPERADAPSQALEPRPVPPALTARDALRLLPGLVEEARQAPAADREAAARGLNAHLEALASGGASREGADLLLQLLEGGQLAGLGEGRGRTCRSVAVEALLSLGFPYALEVRPEDLEHLRASRGDRPRHLLPGIAASTALGAGFITQWLLLPGEFASDEGGLSLPLVLLMGLSLLGLMTALLGPERSNSQRAGLLVLALLSLLQIILSVFGGYHGAVSGAAGLVACLLLLLPRR